MEDSKKMNAQPESATKEGRIVELTPQMEIGAGTKTKIVELTQAMSAPSQAPTPCATPDCAPSALSVSTLADSPPLDAVEHSAIETDINAAFDAMQTPEALQDLPTYQSSDATVELSRIAEHEATESTSTIEPELELSIDDLGNDEVHTAATTPVADAGPGETALPDPFDADDTLELTEVVAPNEWVTEAMDGPSEVIQPPDEIAPADVADEADEVIELHDRVDPTALAAQDADEAIIELVEIVGPEELAAAGAPAQEQDDVLDLTDIVDPIDLSDDPDDEIIELTDIVDPAELAHLQAENEPPHSPREEHPRPVDTPIIEQAVSDDAPSDAPTPAWTASAATMHNVIPMAARDLPAEHQAASAPKNEAPTTESPASEKEQPHLIEEIPEEDDQVIRLDSVLTHMRAKKDKMARDISMGIEDELYGRNTADEMDRPAPPPAESQNALPANFELEKAIEHILQTKYGHTIESLIAKVVEKVVTKEMEGIKRSLIEGEE